MATGQQSQMCRDHWKELREFNPLVTTGVKGTFAADPEIRAGHGYEPSLLHPSCRGQQGKAWNFCTNSPLFLSPWPWVSQSCREAWRKPQVLLRFMSTACESRNSEEFWHKTMDLWCPQERIIQSTTFKITEVPSSMFRAFICAIFRTGRLTHNYTRLVCVFFKKKHNYLWVYLSTSTFQWLEPEATMQGLSSKLCPKFCKPQPAREFSEDLCQKLDIISHWMRAWMWWFRGWQPAQGLSEIAPVQTST